MKWNFQKNYYLALYLLKSSLYGPRITPQIAEWKGKVIQYNTETISQKTCQSMQSYKRIVQESNNKQGYKKKKKQH